MELKICEAYIAEVVFFMRNLSNFVSVNFRYYEKG